MPNPAAVFARSVRKIANAVEPHDCRSLLRTVGLEPEAMDHPSFRIPYADMMLVTEHAARMTKDEAFGLHVGERVEMSEYGVIGSSIATSATLGEALRTQVRFLPIWTNVGAFRLEVDGPVAYFQWEFSERSLPEPRHDCEMSFATLARFSGFSSSVRLRLREVWFRHAKPKDTNEHARIFRAPVHFGMPTNALLFDSRFLDFPLPSSDPSAHAMSVQTAEQLLVQASAEPSFSQCVLSFVRRELESGNFGLDAAARYLGVSRRTLQRRLVEESSSYRELVQQVRQDLSQYLLCGTGQTATETAYALGYSEPSAFQRAFQKWYGMAPGTYRRSC